MFDPLQVQNVESSAEGNDSIAQGIGAVGQAGIEGVEVGGQMKSRTNLLLATNSINKIQQSSLLGMMQNPSNASNIAKNYNEVSQGIQTNASLNTDDKYYLERQSLYMDNSVNSEASRIQIEQQKLGQEMTFQDQWPSNMQLYGQNLINNPAAAQKQGDAMLEMTKGMVLNGSMSLPERENLISHMTDYQAKATWALQNFKSGNLNASHMTAMAITTGQANNPNLPINQNSANHQLIFNNDTTQHDLQSAISQGSPINMNALYALPKAQFQTVQLQATGATQAEADMQSGMSYPAIQEQIKQLQSIKNPTFTQQGYLIRMTNMLNGMKNGQDILANTTSGNALNVQTTAKLAAIANNTTISQQTAAQMTNETINNHISGNINIARSMELPPQYTNPIPASLTVAAQNSFAPNGDPSLAITAAGQLKTANRPWLAKTMAKPNQQGAVYLTGLLAGTQNAGFADTLIRANQDGVDFTKLQAPKNSEGYSPPINNYVNAQLANALAPQLSYLRMLPGGVTQANMMLNSVGNAVKYQALQNGDYNMNNAKQYVANVTNAMNSAFPIIKGSNYAFNTNEIKIQPTQAQNLANFLTDQVKSHGNIPSGDNTEVTYNPIGDYSPVMQGSLMTGYSPTGDVIVTDGNGRIFYRHPYTNSMQQAANVYASQNPIETKTSTIENKVSNFVSAEL